MLSFSHENRTSHIFNIHVIIYIIPKTFFSKCKHFSAYIALHVCRADNNNNNREFIIKVLVKYLCTQTTVLHCKRVSASLRVMTMTN